MIKEEDCLMIRDCLMIIIIFYDILDTFNKWIDKDEKLCECTKDGSTFILRRIPKSETKYCESFFDKLVNVESNYVVKYYEKFEEGDYKYFVMENALFFDWRVNKLNMVFFHLIQGLIDLNKSNICHRDIRPENIFLNKLGMRPFFLYDFFIRRF
jgi:serine/threonine protein kinase